MLNRSYLYSALLLMTLVAACAGLGAFSFSEESDEIIIEPSPLSSVGLDSLFPTHIPLHVDLEQELAKQDASGARSVYLRELYFEMTDESEAESFDFIDEITIRISSRDQNSDLPDRDLAWRDPVPGGQTRFHLDIDEDLDLKPYAEEGLRMRTNASGTSPNREVRFKVYTSFRVNVL